MSKSKMKKKVAVKKSKSNTQSRNEAKVAKALNDLRVVLSTPALAKILNDVLAGSTKTEPKSELPPGTLGHMIPQEHVVPEPVDANLEMVPVEVLPEPVVEAPVVKAPEPVAAKPPAIIVEDRTAGNIADQVPAPQPGYRGELMEVEKLVGLVDPIACEVVNPDVEEKKVGWGKIAKGRMPTLIILTGVNPSQLGGDAKNITYSAYMKKFAGSSREVLNTFVLKRLTGTQGARMLNAYKEFRMQNFEANLGHGGVQVGSDPEIFVEDKKGEVIPAFTFLGSKADTKVKNGGFGNHKVYWDGFQAEFETQQNTCLAYHMDSIQGGLSAVLNAARKVNKDAQLSTKTVIETPFELLQKVEDRFKAFGCAPSLNVYGLKPKEADPNQLTFRPAGGHIHFGCAKQTDGKVVEGVKALDAVLGVAAVSFFRNFDNPIRRQYYGLPGEYRLPPHGIEYRTLSSAWLMHPVTAHMMFELGRKALIFGFNGYRQHWLSNDKETIEVIQNCDVNKAVEILKRNEKIFKRLLSASALIDPGSHAKGRSADIAYNGFLNGCETLIAEPNEIEKNWHLTDKKWIGHSEAANCSWQKAALTFAKEKRV